MWLQSCLIIGSYYWTHTQLFLRHVKRCTLIDIALAFELWDYDDIFTFSFFFQIFYKDQVYFILQNKSHIKNKKAKNHKKTDFLKIPQKSSFGFMDIPISSLVVLVLHSPVFTQCNICTFRVMWQARLKRCLPGFQFLVIQLNTQVLLRRDFAYIRLLEIGQWHGTGIMINYLIMMKNAEL